MKKISFIPKDELTQEILSAPLPSSKKIPQWYKKLFPFIDNNRKIPKGYYLDSNLTAKNCAPIFDCVTAGYIIEFPCDILFLDSLSNKQGFEAVWDVGWEVLQRHGEGQIGDMPIPNDFDKNAWKLIGNWRIRTPPGYSLLYTHPFYRHDLPFLTTTGIVDSDYFDAEINIPFFIKKNFRGIIKKGTPIAQIIPIKRDNWKSEVLKYEENHKFFSNKMEMYFIGAYKKIYWQKKSYK